MPLFLINNLNSHNLCKQLRACHVLSSCAGDVILLDDDDSASDNDISSDAESGLVVKDDFTCTSPIEENWNAIVKINCFSVSELLWSILLHLPLDALKSWRWTCAHLMIASS